MEPTRVPVAKGELSQGVSNDFRAPLLLRSGKRRKCPLWDTLLQAPPPSLEGTTVCHEPDLPVEGRLTRSLQFWSKLTQDPWVLSVGQISLCLSSESQPRLNRQAHFRVGLVCKRSGLFHSA